MLDEGRSQDSDHIGIMMYVTPETHQKLNALSEATGCGMGEIISKALALFDIAVEATSEGDTLAVVDDNGSIKTAIVGTNSDSMSTPFEADKG